VIDPFGFVGDSSESSGVFVVSITRGVIASRPRIPGIIGISGISLPGLTSADLFRFFRLSSSVEDTNPFLVFKETEVGEFLPDFRFFFRPSGPRDPGFLTVRVCFKSRRARSSVLGNRCIAGFFFRGLARETSIPPEGSGRLPENSWWVLEGDRHSLWVWAPEME
jgi:hypothetical protein